VKHDKAREGAEQSASLSESPVLTVSCGAQWEPSRTASLFLPPCNRYFGETQGTSMYDLKTLAAEVAQALMVLMRRGSLRGPKRSPDIHTRRSAWLKQAAYSKALTYAPGLYGSLYPLRGVTPRNGETVSFERPDSTKVTTTVFGWSPEIPWAIEPWNQLKVLTDPVTVLQYLSPVMFEHCPAPSEPSSPQPASVLSSTITCCLPLVYRQFN
jgi:hypothetical protein